MYEICLGLYFLVGFSSVYADNNFNPRTGIYYITVNNFFYRPSNERGNEVIDRENPQKSQIEYQVMLLISLIRLFLMHIQAQLV